MSTGGCACVAFVLSSNSRGRRMPGVQHGFERASQFGVKSPVPDKAYLIEKPAAVCLLCECVCCFGVMDPFGHEFGCVQYHNH